MITIEKTKDGKQFFVKIKGLNGENINPAEPVTRKANAIKRLIRLAQQLNGQVLNYTDNTGARPKDVQIDIS